MYLLPMRTLQSLLHEHGPSLCNDPQRCGDLLRTACPRFPRETQVLLEALELGLVNQLLLAEDDADWWELSAPLIRQLATGGRIATTEARAAIEAWTRVLGIPVRNAPFEPLEAADLVEQRYAAEAYQNHRLGAILGALEGAVAGGSTAGIALALVFRNHGAAIPHPMLLDGSWFAVLVAGIVVGSVVGCAAGKLLGPTHGPLVLALGGAVVGLLTGLFLVPYWSGRGTTSPVAAVVAVNGVIGMTAGGLLSMVAGSIVRATQELRRYRHNNLVAEKLWRWGRR